MRQHECPFEADALSYSNDPELRAHVSGCPICSELVAVARAIEAENQRTRPEIAVPDSGRVWWLAQLRARREAAQTAARPITAAQVVAFAAAVALLGACFGATSSWFQESLHGAAAAVRNMDVKAIVPMLTEHAVLIAAMLAVLVVLPAVVYLAVVRDER